MKKIFIHQDLLEVLNDIIGSNDNGRTKIARTLVKAATEGLPEENFVPEKKGSDYFAFSEHPDHLKKMIAYVKFDKFAKKLREINEIGEDDEITDEMLAFNERFFDKEFVSRTFCKPSKIIRRLFTEAYRSDNFSKNDVEYFVNQYRSIIQNGYDLVEVKGEDIRKWYNVENYASNDGSAPNGSLQGSCMGATRKGTFMDIYVKNENISMLVAINGNNKILGRAIIWDNVTIKERDSAVEVKSGVKFMDRIYYTHDWLVPKFKKWAKERNIYTKHEQSHARPFRVDSPDGETDDYYLEVEVDLSHKFLPYLDTFQIPNYKRGYLTNKTDGYDNNSILRAYDNGTPSMVWDSIEGKLVYSNDSEWTDEFKSWIHIDDRIRVSGDNFHKKLCKKDRLGGFITPKDNEVTCVVTGDPFAEREMVTSEHHDGLIHKKEAVETIDAGIVHKDEAVDSRYLGGKLSKSGSIKMEKLDDYLPKSVLEVGLSVEDFEKVIETLNDLKGEKGNLSESSTFVFEF